MESVVKKTLLVDVEDGGIVTVTMNRPHRKNAADATMWVELAETWTEFGSDPDTRVLVMTGAEDAFCAGADLNPQDRGTKHQLQAMHDITRTALALHRIPKPTIAKVNGVAAGAGCNIALGCDLIVAGDTARFTEIFAKRGLSVDFGGTWLLPRLVGLHRAKEIAFFGDILSAQEAERLGLVNRVVPGDELDAVVGEWAARLAAGPPLALSMTKRMLNDAVTRSFEDALEAEGVSQTVNFSTEDTAEAISAFLQKREPEFTGR
ncbi:MAG: enoyl-CoA hydratase [Actinomycetota bacterium]